MDDCAALLAEAARAAGSEGIPAFAARPPIRLPSRSDLTVAEAFARYAGVDLLATIDASGRADRTALAAASRTRSALHGDDDTWADIFSRVLSNGSSHSSALAAPTILYEYPLP